MTANPYSHAPPDASPSASPSTAINQPATPPSSAGAPASRTGVSVLKPLKQVESWKFNPAYKGRNGGEAPWIPGELMPHREHLQLVRQGSFNQYKFVPQPPSAEYLAMKLSDNPLGLMDMAPVSIEEYYLQGQSNPNVLARDDDTNVYGGDSGSEPAYSGPTGTLSLSSSSINLTLMSNAITSTLPPFSEATISQHLVANHHSTPIHLQDPASYNSIGTPTPNQTDNGDNNHHSPPSLNPTFSASIVRTPDHYRSPSSLRGNSSPTRDGGGWTNIRRTPLPKPVFSAKIVRTPKHHRSSSPLRENARETVTSPKAAASSSLQNSPRDYLSGTSPNASRKRGKGKDKDTYAYARKTLRPLPGVAEDESVAGPSSIGRARGSRRRSVQREHTNARSLHATRSLDALLADSSATVDATSLSGSLAASAPSHMHFISPYPDYLQHSPRIRRGYWNKRGDHLTPDGYIIYAPHNRAYPEELATYPPEEEGYRNHEGEWRRWAERPELPESLLKRGRMPERPYEGFVVYVDRTAMESLAQHGSRRSSTDSLPSSLLSTYLTRRHSHDNVAATTTSSLDPNLRRPQNQRGRFIDDSSSTHGSMLDAETKQKPDDSLSRSKPSRVDPWDLDARLAMLNARRPKTPTSSSSDYGSPHSARSRASSWSNSPGGHIPGTTRDVLEFPFGYPTTPN